MTYIMNKINIISIFTAYMCLLAIADSLLVGTLLPQSDSVARYAVPVYFWLLYATVVLLLKKGLDGDTVAKYFMFFKGVKMLLTMIVMLVAALIFRDSAKEIIVTFFVYYVALLLPESIFVARMRK